jgi:DNA-binding CsgD family transcriptional regulator
LPHDHRRLVEELVRRRQPGSGPPELAELTDREREVLVLIATVTRTPRSRHGSSSARPLKTHVNRVFQRIGVRDRVQAVVLAYESGLVRPGEASVVGEEQEAGVRSPSHG